MARFFKFTDNDEETAYNFTAGEWRLFARLRLLDPYGEKYQEISTLEILSKCNISKATFYRAIAKFQSLGLFDFQDKGFTFRNLANSSDSQKRDSCIKNETGILKNETDFLKNETGILKNETASIYKEFKIPKTLSEALSEFSEQERERIEKFCKKEAELLPEPPRLVTKWILKNLDDLLEKYREVNPSAFSSNKQVEKSSEVVNPFKNIDPAIADSLHPLIKQGLIDGSIVAIAPNWRIGVHQIRLFGGRWVEAKNWINSQLPKAEISEELSNQLKAVGGGHVTPTT